jgi:hypothetical protein
MTTKNRIGLRIPAQSPPHGKAIFLSEKETAEWVDGLPLANIGETSRQIYQTLHEHNRTLIPYKKRFLSTELLRQPIEYVGTNLQKHYVNVGFPLSEKAHKVAMLNRELHNALATAYKSIVVDIVVANHGKSDYRLLSTAIHRAIHHLSKMMLLSVLVYEPYPTNTWFELHVLHRLACRYHLESQNVEDLLETSDDRSSIDEIYRRAALFCLSSPYKIRQRENIVIFEALLDWARYTRLYDPSETPLETSIVLKRDEDSPPTHTALHSEFDSSHVKKMDVSRLIEQLREQFDDAKPQQKLSGADTLEKNLLRQLIYLWSSEQKRTFVRTKLNFELRIAVGLNRIYQLVFQGEDKPVEEPQKTEDQDTDWINKKYRENKLFDISARFTLEPVEADDKPAVRRRDFEAFGPNSYDDSAELPEPAAPIWQSPQQPHQPQPTFRCKTLNESAGGYCLDWKGSQTPKILVGELIGVQSSLVKNQFGLGLVRWMKKSPQQSLQVGIQMIAPNAQAILAKQGNHGHSTVQECLLLPEVGTSGQPSSFICPSVPFHVGDRLVLENGDSSREIKLTRLLESSGSISQFQFIYTDQQTVQTEDPTEEGDFDNLWSTL